MLVKAFRCRCQPWILAISEQRSHVDGSVRIKLRINAVGCCLIDGILSHHFVNQPLERVVPPLAASIIVRSQWVEVVGRFRSTA